MKLVVEICIVRCLDAKSYCILTDLGMYSCNYGDLCTCAVIVF